MNIIEILNKVVKKEDLSSSEMSFIMRKIMTGKATDSQIASLLTGLAIKGETTDEILGAAIVMRDIMSPVEVNVAHQVDTCGTGGDNANVFNVSTASAFVVCAAGATVTKHGNRSVSSKTGSADVLETAGAEINLDKLQIERCINEVGIGFMFAPVHHSAMRFAIGPRKELGFRTIFNILGPLTNPARVSNQVLGVFDEKLLIPVAKVLQALNSRHVLVVCSEDGLDEFSISTSTKVVELKRNSIEQFVLSPKDVGLKKSAKDDLLVTNAEESLNMIMRVLNCEDHPATDIVKYNAGAAIYVSGLSASIKSGIEKASKVLKDGRAMNKFNQFIKMTNELAKH